MEQRKDQAQVVYIDGCKITVKYSSQENPSVIRNIKNTLISGTPTKKD